MSLYTINVKNETNNKTYRLDQNNITNGSFISRAIRNTILTDDEQERCEFSRIIRDDESQKEYCMTYKVFDNKKIIIIKSLNYDYSSIVNKLSDTERSVTNVTVINYFRTPKFRIFMISGITIMILTILFVLLIQ